MPTPPVSDDQLRRTLDAVQEHGSNSAAARALDISECTVRRQLRIARERDITSTKVSPIIDNIELPTFPDEDVSVEQIVDLQCKRFEQRKASHDAHTWFSVRVNDDSPIGILWFGDPHVDDNGCNWPVLRRHVALCRDTDGLYGANIGDTTNNWSGRLIKLYANQDTSVKTARRLAKWFMLDSGVPWLVWLLGNHDVWGDGAEILALMAKQYGTQKVVCHDWEARFQLCFPNGWSPRIFAAHDFKGHSQWNPLHGPMKAGQMGADADLYVAGHKHNVAAFEFENADRGRYQRFIRVRGYKFMDDYARRLGIVEQEEGCAVLTIFNPHAKTQAGRIVPFVDVEEGVDFLKWSRKRHAKAA